jgi:hypothetical protein
VIPVIGDTWGEIPPSRSISASWSAVLAPVSIAMLVGKVTSFT